MFTIFVLFADQVTIYFLKDQVSGRKKRIYGPNVQHITIPAYEGLTLKDIAEFAQDHPQVNDYLPDGKEVMKMSKQWIANVIHSVLKKTFSNWVKQQVEKRNREMVVERGLTIEMDTEVAAAFEASTKTSVLHGAGVHMLKAGSKRRRTKAEIASGNDAKTEEENIIRIKMARLDEMEQQLASQEAQLAMAQNQLHQKDQQLQENDGAAVLVNDLMNAGIVRRESDHAFVAKNAEGERRFDYDHA